MDIADRECPNEVFTGLKLFADFAEGEFCSVFEKPTFFKFFIMLDELLTYLLLESAGLLFHLVGVMGFLSVSMNDSCDSSSFWQATSPKISASTAS